MTQEEIELLARKRLDRSVENILLNGIQSAEADCFLLEYLKYVKDDSVADELFRIKENIEELNESVKGNNYDDVLEEIKDLVREAVDKMPSEEEDWDAEEEDEEE